jgi:hypothetical protein
MTAEQIRELVDNNVGYRVGGSLDEPNLLNALIGEIAAQLAEIKELASLLASVCGDRSGPAGKFCTLERGHRGEHQQFWSGGCIGWPNEQ